MKIAFKLRLKMKKRSELEDELLSVLYNLLLAQKYEKSGRDGDYIHVEEKVAFLVQNLD